MSRARVVCAESRSETRVVQKTAIKASTTKNTGVMAASNMRKRIPWNLMGDAPNA